MTISMQSLAEPQFSQLFLFYPSNYISTGESLFSVVCPVYALCVQQLLGSWFDSQVQCRTKNTNSSEPENESSSTVSLESFGNLFCQRFCVVSAERFVKPDARLGDGAAEDNVLHCHHGTHPYSLKVSHTISKSNQRVNYMSIDKPQYFMLPIESFVRYFGLWDLCWLQH